MHIKHFAKARCSIDITSTSVGISRSGCNLCNLPLCPTQAQWHHTLRSSSMETPPRYPQGHQLSDGRQMVCLHKVLLLQW